MRLTFYISGSQDMLLVNVDSVYYDDKKQTITVKAGDKTYTVTGKNTSSARTLFNELSVAGCASLFDTPEELKQGRAEALFK